MPAPEQMLGRRKQYANGVEVRDQLTVRELGAEKEAWKEWLQHLDELNTKTRTLLDLCDWMWGDLCILYNLSEKDTPEEDKGKWIEEVQTVWKRYQNTSEQYNETVYSLAPATPEPKVQSPTLKTTNPSWEGPLPGTSTRASKSFTMPPLPGQAVFAN